LKRVLSVLFIIPPLLLFVLLGPPWSLSLVVLGVSLLALREFYRLTLGAGGMWPLLGIVPVALAHWGDLEGVALSPLLVLFLISLHHLIFGPTSLDGLRRSALLFLGTIYVPFTMAHLILLVRLPEGMKWLLLLVACLWIGDTVALLVGNLMGRRPLAPRVSPKKTVEGALGCLAGVGLTLLLFRALYLPHMSLSLGVLLALGIGVLGQLGDLSESLIKRAAGVKDSGSLIPGHGGMLDRLDSFLFTSPFVYYLLRMG